MTIKNADMPAMPNRAIKFRSWNSVDDAMVSPSMVERYFPNLMSSKHYHLMQFTGLTDMDGKEIYEGDIIRLDPKKPEYDAVIVWQEDTASFSCHKASDHLKTPYCDHLYGGGWTKVIGNIYQNPELLEK